MSLLPFLVFAEEKVNVVNNITGYISVDTPGIPPREFQIGSGEVLNSTIRSDARTEIHFTNISGTVGNWRIIGGGVDSFTDYGATCNFFPGSTSYNYIELEIDVIKDGATATVGFKIFFNK